MKQTSTMVVSFKVEKNGKNLLPVNSPAPLEPGPLNHSQAIGLGELAASMRAHGISMGDAICLSVAGWSDRTAVTAERRWKEALPGAKILTIR